MPTYKVETIDKWNKFADRLREKEYRPWQYQYSWDDKNGFHVWFMKAGCEDIEIVTRSEEVQKAILKFKPAD
jgi:hypothetical protein